MAGRAVGLGRWLWPTRFVTFLVLLVALGPALHLWFRPLVSFLLAFDIAGAVFILSVVPLFRPSLDAVHMRRMAERNDANRLLLLLVSGAVLIAVLGAIALELGGPGRPAAADIGLVIGSLLVAWVFGNLIYTLHYAHMFYLRGDDGRDCGGIAFPATHEPDYWDFLYFAFTLGMTFQTSDVAIESAAVRRVVIFHSAAAFVFNIGVLAFTINVLGN